MYSFLGHTTQVLHLVIAWTVYFYSGYANFYVALIFTIAVLLSWPLLGGDCFANHIAKYFFRKAGRGNRQWGFKWWFYHITGVYCRNRFWLTFFSAPPFLGGLAWRFIWRYRHSAASSQADSQSSALLTDGSGCGGHLRLSTPATSFFAELLDFYFGCYKIVLICKFAQTTGFISFLLTRSGDLL